MKKIYSLLFMICLSSFLFGDVYDQSHKMLQIETEHFTFIFPEESQNTAGYLASMAEDIYREITEKLDAPQNLKIPVVISPDTQQLNGYFSNYPSNRIMLYEAPILPNSGFALYNNNLKKLFLHELTHAVSLSTRGLVTTLLSDIFGDVVSLITFTRSFNFVEGVTVSFESADGFGRANDTPYNAIVQQDILEGNFRTFGETEGINQGYPGGLWYVYGSTFSRFLQEEYGMEAYANLWKEFGNGRFLDRTFFTEGAFSRAYDMDFDQIWEEFRQWIQIKGPVVMETRPLSEDLYYFTAITAKNGNLYYATRGGIYQFNTETESLTKLVPMDSSVNRLDLSPDGKTLLISCYQTGDDGMATAIIKRLDIDSRHYSDIPEEEGLVEAAYLSNNTLAAIEVDGYTTNLVVLENGERKVLIHGSERIIPSMPSLFQEDSLIFLLQVEGINHLAKWDLASRKLEIIQTESPLEGIRNLYCNGNEITFIYDNDLSLFKLGKITEEGLFIEETPITGGVQFPVLSSGKIYYAGYFSDGHKLMEFPEDNPSLGLSPVDYQWIPFNQGELDQVSAFDQANSLPVKPYNVLSWILIPQIRYPVLAVDNTIEGWDALFKENSYRGAGLTGISSDPTEAYSLDWTLKYLWDDIFLDADIAFGNTSLPMESTLGFYDNIIFNSSTGDTRSLGGSAVFRDSLTFFPSYKSLTYIFGAGINTMANEVSETSPYKWELNSPTYPIVAYLGYNSIIQDIFPPKEVLGWGFDLSYNGLISSSDSVDFSGYVSTNFQLYLPFFHFTSKLSGSVAINDLVSLSLNGPYQSNTNPFPSSVDTFQTYNCYTHRTDLTGNYSLYGDTSLAQEFITETSLPGNLYIQSFDLKAGYRNAWIDNTYLDSLYLLTTVDLYWTKGVISNTLFQLGVELEYALGELPGSAYFARLFFMGQTY